VFGFTSRPLYPHGKTPGTLWIGGWVDVKLQMEIQTQRVKL